MNVETITGTHLSALLPETVSGGCRLEDFWELSIEDRNNVLEQAIFKVHAWHYTRNSAYRHTLEARGVGGTITSSDLPLILRPTAQTFKSYIDILGTPFPQDCPADFINWLADQLSIRLPDERFASFRSRYASLEDLLSAVEDIYEDYGLEVITSSGTSGRSTIMLRDQDGIDKTVESFYLSFQRYLEMQAEHRAIFIMPRITRIAMVRMAAFSVGRIGIEKNRIHFTIPFPAYPDQVRIRTGRTYRPGTKGLIERRLLNPFMNWAYENLAAPRTLRSTVEILDQAESNKEKVLLFGGWIQLHNIALQLRKDKRSISLPPGSLIGTGGGMKELYPFTPSQIRGDLIDTFKLTNDQAIPIRDVYGMAEGNWAAMQCRKGNYHIPPWVYAVTLDDDNKFQEGADTTGLLAFYDPYGGGQLFPSFFKTADRVRLINGGISKQFSNLCPCGDAGSYILQESIQRVDLMDEAGCAAQV